MENLLNVNNPHDHILEYEPFQ